MRRIWGRFWRRSLQARMVISTLVLTVAAVTVVTLFLTQQVRDGLLDHRVDVAVAESNAEIEDAQDRLSAASLNETNAERQQRDLVELIIDRGASRGYSIVMAGPLTDGAGRIVDGGAEFTPGLDTSSVPASLEDHFVSGGTATAWAYTELVTVAPVGDVSTEPGLVVGSDLVLPADGQRYVVYFLFSLQDEEDTLALVTRSLWGAGLFLLMLMGLASWIVASHVVNPIRLARQVAERISVGELQERLVVHGEDDLARLALSFNQMVDTLQRQFRRLEDLSRLQRRFTSDVSHELRTPLTTVRMAADMLHDAREDFDPASSRAAELLQTELDRFERLLSDLLEISRFDAGVASLDLDDINLVEVAQRVIDGTAHLARQRGVRVVIDAPVGGCFAEADVRRVERIVRNLVSNAIDHAAPPGDHPEGDVIISIGADETAAAISVRDFGIGLAPGESAMVFNRFWRADPARARTSGGTGLGLAIALEDATLHGGWLQAWGQPGVGAVFRLTLPRRGGGAVVHSPIPLVPASVRGQR